MRTRTFDIAEMLKTDEDIHEFLAQAYADGTPEEFIHALNIAVRAVGMTEVAKRAGVTRASLYKSLSEGGKPQFATIVKVTEALGCKLQVA